MGRIGRKIGSALGGILAGEAAKTGLAKKAFGMGIGNKKLLTTGGQTLGSKVGDLIPFKNGGVVMVVKKPRKRKSRK